MSQEFRHLGIVLKLGKSGAWFLYLNPFQFEFPKEWKTRNLSQGTYDFQNFGNETLFIADHEDIKKFTFVCLPANYRSKKALLCEKFALLKEWIWTNIQDYLFVNHHFHAAITLQLTGEKQKFYIVVTSDYHSFIP